MSALKNYFQNEAKREMLGLEHPKPSDFYIGVWQTTRSSVPLMILRGLLFLSSLAIVLFSISLYIVAGKFKFYFIFLTHWGLMLLIVTTAFATAVSARVYFAGPISTEFCLPWYIKTYWVLYNISNPIAILITIFYWTVLFKAGVHEEPNVALDVLVHGLNTVVMLVLLITAGHPIRLLHIHHPVMFGLAWVFFSIIYYFAGGTNPEGERYIYSVIDWSKPGTAVLVLFLTAVLLLVLHLIVLGMTVLRDYAARRCLRPSVTHRLEEGTPLRQTIAN